MKKQSQPMKSGRIAEMLALAAKAEPPAKGLKGQGEVALVLAGKGFGPTAIARFLAEHGSPVSVATVWRYLRQQQTPQSLSQS
jgi:precorrin-6B methylase 1